MNILFIEDDVIEIMKLHRTLAKLGLKHEIIEAKNGEEALKVLNSGSGLPDIIFSERNMSCIMVSGSRISRMGGNITKESA